MSEAARNAYREQIERAYPFHPLLIDALYTRWGSHPDFQRTRGVLRLMAADEDYAYVVWTDDLTPYRTRKVRILNGAHTASVLAAFHAGLNTVRETVEELLHIPVVGRIVAGEPVPVPQRPACPQGPPFE